MTQSFIVKFLYCTMALLLLPISAFAQETVVVRGKYFVVWDKKESPERAKMVADRVEAAARENIERKVVRLDLDCTDKACLENSLSSSDTGILANVEEYEGSFKIEVISNLRTVTGDYMGPFSEALEEIRRLTLLTLKPEETPPPQDEGTDTPSSEAADPPQEPRGLPRPLLASSIGFTAATTLSWGIIELVGYTKLKSFRDTLEAERTQADREALSNLRIADRVFLGAAIVGAVTTTTLLIVHRNKKKKSVSLTPSVSFDGGGLILTGSF